MNFVTIFDRLNYKHFAKDIGMIPYVLQKHYGYQSEIIGCSPIINFIPPYADYKVNVKIIKRITPFDSINMAIYLWQNASRINILNLYHFNVKRNLFYTIVYKLRNKKGRIYLKLDFGKRGLYQCLKEGWLKRYTKKRMFHYIDLISCENKFVSSELTKLYGKTVNYVPNGWYGDFRKNTSIREPLLLYVGRIGIKEKGVDVLLEAFAKAIPLGYKLQLVGKIEESFKDYIDEYYIRYPHLKERVLFKGEVRNRTELDSIYNESKILIVPSKWESFGIVMAEGLAHGCYIIASDGVSSAEDIISSYELGKTFKTMNIEDLSETLSHLDELPINISKIYEKAKEYNWYNICKKLFDWLNEGESQNTE